MARRQCVDARNIRGKGEGVCVTSARTSLPELRPGESLLKLCRRTVNLRRPERARIEG
jgi:hypothetical protein